MAGILYGIGVGPGDPELITLKAVRLIKECNYIVAPGKSIEESFAFSIAKQAVPSIETKKLMVADFPMTKNQEELTAAHNRIAQEIILKLKEGEDIAFLTIGDPTVYSTYIYIHKQIIAAGYKAKIINGVPSFCVASGALNQGLAEMNEEIHIIPASYDIDQALKLKGTKVLMKSGKRLEAVKEKLINGGFQASFVENASLENEKIYLSPEELPAEGSYFTIGIVK